MCKGKGTLLQTPTVLQPHNRLFSQPLQTYQNRFFTGPLSITFRFLCKILAQCFEVLQHGGLYSFDSYFTFVFFLLVHVAASKERMMQHKECFGAKSFESVAFERFVR